MEPLIGILVSFIPGSQARHRPWHPNHEASRMGYSPPEWIVIVFILVTFAGVLYQSYLAGHLVYLGLATLVTLLGAGLLYKGRKDSKPTLRD